MPDLLTRLATSWETLTLETRGVWPAWQVSQPALVGHDDLGSVARLLRSRRGAVAGDAALLALLELAHDGEQAGLAARAVMAAMSGAARQVAAQLWCMPREDAEALVATELWHLITHQPSWTPGWVVRQVVRELRRRALRAATTVHKRTGAETPVPDDTLIELTDTMTAPASAVCRAGRVAALAARVSGPTRSLGDTVDPSERDLDRAGMVTVLHELRSRRMDVTAAGLVLLDLLVPAVKAGRVGLEDAQLLVDAYFHGISDRSIGAERGLAWWTAARRRRAAEQHLLEAVA